MKFLKSVEMACPLGYVPVSRPKEWNLPSQVLGSDQKDNSCPVIRFTIRQSDVGTSTLEDCFAKRINDHVLVRNACYQQLTRTPVNDFIIGIEKLDMNNPMISSNHHDKVKFPDIPDLKTIMYSIETNQIYIFQKNLKFSPESVEVR